MELVFKLRPEFEGVTGVLQYGANGEELNLAEDLNQGAIRTEDANLQKALLLLHGEQERVFDAFTADGEPFDSSTLMVEEPPIAQSADAPAEHAGGSTYDGLTKEELLEEVANRGLDASSSLKKAELVAALEANDAQGGTSSGSDS